MKKLQLVTKVLAIVLISAIAFVGVYVQNQNRMENKVKDYQLGMDLAGKRVMLLKINDEKETITKDENGKVIEESEKEEGKNYTTEEIPVNDESVLTTENYKKTKAIIEKRLKQYNVDQYEVRLDEVTGQMAIVIPENDNADYVASNVTQGGEFQIVDSEDDTKVLMDNNDIKRSNVMYNTTQSGTTVYLNIEFNKAGAEKLKNISQEYIKVEETTTNEEESTEAENTTSDTETESTEAENTEETKQKQVKMQIDGSAIATTSFPEVMENGSMQLSMSAATTSSDTINDNFKTASAVATVLDTGMLPVKYTIESNEYIAAQITNSDIQKAAIAVLAIIGLALIMLIIKYKKYGLLSSISYIGLVAIYSLLIRYTNVELTIEGIVGVGLILILNYILNLKILDKIKDYGEEEIPNAIKDVCKEFFIQIIPICIFSIVVCFIRWAPLFSFGMTMFWGLAVIAIYNLIITKNFLRI